MEPHCIVWCMAKRPYHDKEVLEKLYFEEGLSQKEIAEKFGVVHQTISEWMNRHDINPGIEAGQFDRVERASYFVGSHGYPNVAAWNKDKKQMEHVKVHRLLAVAKYGFDEIKGMDVHHKNEHRMDNRPDNIELLTPGEHMRHHGEKQADKMDHDEDTGQFLRVK